MPLPGSRTGRAGSIGSTAAQITSTTSGSKARMMKSASTGCLVQDNPTNTPGNQPTRGWPIRAASKFHLGDAPLNCRPRASTTRIVADQRGFSADSHTQTHQTHEQSGLANSPFAFRRFGAVAATEAPQLRTKPSQPGALALGVEPVATEIEDVTSVETSA